MFENLNKRQSSDLEYIKEYPEFYNDMVEIYENKDLYKKYKSLPSLFKETKKKIYIKLKKEELSNGGTLKNVILGDALENLKNIESKSIGLVITDPPYGIDFSHSWSPLNNILDDSININDTLPLILKELERVMKDDAHIYIFSSYKNYPEFSKIFAETFELKNCIVWVKNNSSLCDFDQRYGFSHEFILFGTKKNAPKRLLQHTEGNMTKDVIFSERVANPDHSCEKPVKLLEKLIETSSFEGEIVLDCFAGSGSTLVAANNLNRNYIGIEYDEKWWALIQTKLDNDI